MGLQGRSIATMAIQKLNMMVLRQAVAENGLQQKH